MKAVFDVLAEAGIEAYEASFSALDAYFGAEAAPVRFILAACDLQDLAASIDAIRYPGLYFADAALDTGPAELVDAGRRSVSTYYFHCAEFPAETQGPVYAQLDLYRDVRRDVFLDPHGVYPTLRRPILSFAETQTKDSGERRLFETAVLLSRYMYELPQGGPEPESPRDCSIEFQRALLSLILTGQSPWRGLEYLRQSGFIERYWPELERLSGTNHSKEYHPEGDAWAHTLETFRHRKAPSLGLSLALLLHDIGKPGAESSEGRQFDGHAEIGRSIAERFLVRLGFPPALIAEVSFLVRYHMIPAALPRLPSNRLEGIIDNPHFPDLLELYKCDELSTFRGPEGYYEACSAYKAWLKNSRNPYRNADGKKLARSSYESRRFK
jgi:poly(A) polymerase